MELNRIQAQISHKLNNNCKKSPYPLNQILILKMIYQY